MISFEQRELIRQAYEYEGFYDISDSTDLRCDINAIFNWIKYFTPIERNVWSDIRSQQIPFLPQYQVGKYYPDFANPVLKIIIEVDGKHHNEERQSNHDQLRDQWLQSQGWSIFRIKGKETYKDISDYFPDLDSREYVDMSFSEKRKRWSDFLHETSAGFFYALNVLAGVYQADEYTEQFVHGAVGRRSATQDYVIPKFVHPTAKTIKSFRDESLIEQIFESMNFYADHSKRIGGL